MNHTNNQDPSDFFEKFVGALFEELRCDAKPHPPVNGRFSDYLVTTPDGDSLFVEATVLQPEQFSKFRPTEEDVRKKLDEICEVPYLYWFLASASGELYQNVAKKKLAPIKKWMEGLRTENLRPQSANFSFPSGTPPPNAETPSTVWEIEIDAAPRSKDKRGIPDVLLAGFGRGGGIDAVSPLIDKAREKVKQHKDADKPVVVAINDTADFSLHRIDVSVALFGWEQKAETGISRITPYSEDMRRPSLWGRRKNSTISGILLFQGLRPDSVQSATVCLYENPWPRYPMPYWLKVTFPHAYVKEEQSIHYLEWPPDERLSSVLNSSPVDNFREI